MVIQSCNFSNCMRNVEFNVLRIVHSDTDGRLIMHFKLNSLLNIEKLG